MAPTGPELVHTWFEEVWNKGRVEAIDEYAGEHWVGQGLAVPGGPEISHREKFKVLHRNFRAAFPDITITVDRTVSDGDYTAAHCTVRATHLGDGLGFPATGLPVHFHGTAIAHTENGKLVETWESWDFLGMYAQLGRNPV